MKNTSSSSNIIQPENTQLKFNNHNAEQHNEKLIDHTENEKSLLTEMMKRHVDDACVVDE